MHPTIAEQPRLDTPPAAVAVGGPQGRNEAERCGFQIGWDHARHGLAPAAALLVDATAVGQGWRAGKAVFGRRQLPTTPALRNWLRLRTEAWCAGLPFDGSTVTPKWLAGIAVSHCPVTRMPLGGAPAADSAPVFVCLGPNAGYRAGNLVVLSRRAATAIPTLDLRSAGRAAAVPAAVRAIAKANTAATATPANSSDVDGDAAAPPPLRPEQAARLAVLLSQCTALPFCEAASLPLHLLPPPQVQPANPVQVLQAWLTRQFAAPGWSARLRGLADTLPADARGQADTALRHDFNLFIGALAPRLLGTGSDGRVPDTALEDAWSDQRVQRRWQRFTAALGEERTTLLLGLITSRAGARPVARPAARAGERAGERADVRPDVRPDVRAGRSARSTEHHGAGRGALRARAAPGADVKRSAPVGGSPDVSARRGQSAGAGAKPVNSA
jgi:hypothetical protein